MSVLAASALCALLAMPLGGQEDPRPETGTFEESVQVQVVNLEVVVTNREDERVTGLSPACQLNE